MKTERLTDPAAAARLIRQGRLVAFPTETVFGLGVDATNRDAVARLFAAKGRPSDNPLIVHVSDTERWALAASRLTKPAEMLLRAFAPGPLTVILPKLDSICQAVTAGLPSVGLRIPDCRIAREMLREAGLPVAAPSANLSGRPSCTRWESVLEDLEGRIDAILCQNPIGFGLESTVVDCTHEPPRLLRPGMITLEQLRGVVPDTVGFEVGELQTQNSEKPILDAHDVPAMQPQGKLPTPPLSPGLSHPHYQPKARVLLYESDPTELNLSEEKCRRATCCGVTQPRLARLYLRCHIFRDMAAYAEHFYEVLRIADRLQADYVLCQLAPAEGIGVALRDRQLRAAARQAPDER